LDHEGMIVTLHTQGLQTLAQVRAFVPDNEPIPFRPENRQAAYDWIAATLRQFGYARCIKQFIAGDGNIKGRCPCLFCAPRTALQVRGHPSAGRYGALHGTPSGTTTRKLCERAFKVHGDVRFERLAGISNRHLYNLRQHMAHQTKRGSFGKTRPARVNIGERRKPSNAPPGHHLTNHLRSGLCLDWKILTCALQTAR